MQHHAMSLTGPRKRTIHVANLDPAAEHFGYELAFDIRDLISVEEVMEELNLGPNGALIYCMEYLLQNLDWLNEQLDTLFDDDDYVLLDCPGQIELYTHIPLMSNVINSMKLWGYDSTMVGVFLIDTTFVADTPKFISGSLLSLSAMIALELPHVNILTKCDLISEEDVDRILNLQSASEIWDREQDRNSLLPADYEDYTNTDDTSEDDVNNDETSGNVAHGNATTTVTTTDEASAAAITKQQERQYEIRRRQRQRLTDCICQLLDDYTMVSYLPLNIQDEDSIDHVLSCVDATIQWGEDREVYGRSGDFGEEDGDE